MNHVIRGALSLAALATLWTTLVYTMRWHLDAALYTRIGLPPIFALTIVMIYLTLRKTADSQAYRQQFAAGAMLGTIGGLLIAATTWLLLTVLFPQASAETNEAMIELLRAQGEVDAQTEEFYRSFTPFRKATISAWFTLMVSIVSSAILAIGNRRQG